MPDKVLGPLDGESKQQIKEHLGIRLGCTSCGTIFEPDSACLCHPVRCSGSRRVDAFRRSNCDREDISPYPRARRCLERPHRGAAAAAPAVAASPCGSLQLGQQTTAYARPTTASDGGPNGYANNSTVQNGGRYLGTDTVIRWWEWVNAANSGGADIPANYTTFTRYWTTPIGANQTLTVSGTLEANLGNNCYTCSSGAGIMLQWSINGGTTWTTGATHVTRTGMGAVGGASTLPIATATNTNTTTAIPSGATTITWGHSTWNTWAGTTTTSLCYWSNFYSGGGFVTSPQTSATSAGLLYSDLMTYSFQTWSATATTLSIRAINFIQPRTTTCTGAGGATVSNDDIALSDPKYVCTVN